MNENLDDCYFKFVKTGFSICAAKNYVRLRRNGNMRHYHIEELIRREQFTQETNKGE